MPKIPFSAFPFERLPSTTDIMHVMNVGGRKWKWPFEKYVFTVPGIQDVSHISEELFLCDSGDEIRPLNERCNKIDECNDKSDEKDCIHCK